MTTTNKNRRGFPDVTGDPLIAERKRELIEEMKVLLDAIRDLVTGISNPMMDLQVLAKVVEIGLLDAPPLINNLLAKGDIRTGSIDGAIQAADERGSPVKGRMRVLRCLETQ